MSETWTLDSDRLFEPSRRKLASELYGLVEGLPLICPHGHVDAKLLADPEAGFGSPADLFVIPDHYVFRMLYSRGVPMEKLGVAARDGSPVENDHRKIWQRFCENFHLFAGTPSGLWLSDELINVFGVEEKPNSANARKIYDHIENLLSKPEYSPRSLFERFGVEVLCTTDAATDSLEAHISLREDGWKGKVRPTFRPDSVMDTVHPDWRGNVAKLSEVSGVDITDFASFVAAIKVRREFFKSVGAVATDHSVLSPRAERLPTGEVESIFGRALAGGSSEADAGRFMAHMLWEMAAMSVEDGLVMQLHAGSFRNHNAPAHERFGSDAGADIPVGTEWTRNLRPLLNDFGGRRDFRLIVYTLDESSYSRELAPLAGHYPALCLGAPWWFFDSPNGMRRYLDSVVETAGIFNLAGFNDDTRAFASIPARHDVWRRVASDWVAGQQTQGIIDEEDARMMIRELAYELPKRAYGLESERA